jgi:hypothetical protein
MERIKFPTQDISSLETFASNSHLVINKRLLIHYGPEKAIFISNLIDKFLYFKHKNMLNNGSWFFLIHEQQINQTGLTDFKIRTCKKFFLEEKILFTKRFGNPSKEWYKIDPYHLQTLINFSPAKTEGQSPRKPKGSNIYYSNIYNKDNKYKENIIPSTEKIVNKNKEYIPLAKKLSEIIKLKKNITHTSQQINSWANDIRRLVKENCVSIDRIKKALDWYENNIGGKFIPVIESGASLREKFFRLEAAMERDCGKYNSESESDYEEELPDRIKNQRR